MKVIDAENKILGRLASNIASKAREGEEVRIVNSEKAVISGSKEKVLDDYKQKYDRGTRHRGPYFPQRPEKILKRTVKNMLPDGSEGRESLSRIKTFIGKPERFEEPENPDVKEGDDLKNRNYVKLSEVSKHIGWEPKGEIQ
ncbi:MAG: 50S ribosomal protein L13 [Candidatus Nanohaloarchaea archaeon]